VGQQGELRVTVEGDLPDEVIQQIGSAVQNAVRSEMAKIDLLKGFREKDFPSITGDDGPTGLVASGQFG
jgi:hypothetical protein